jgi:hypothetical protein
MPNSEAIDSKECNTELRDKIHIRKYKTRQHHVFSVYRGNQHWKRLRRRKNAKTAIWVERRFTEPNSPATDKDVIWLNHIFENPEKFKRVSRFPRTGGQLAVPSIDFLTWQNLPRFDPFRVPETRWLIDSFLADRSIQLVFGEPGSFKSTLLLFASRAVASKKHFLGMKTLAELCIWIMKTLPMSLRLDVPIWV